MLSMEPLSQTILLIIAWILSNITLYLLGAKKAKKVLRDVAEFLRAAGKLANDIPQGKMVGEILENFSWYIERQILDDVDSVKEDMKMIVQKYQQQQQKS